MRLSNARRLRGTTALAVVAAGITLFTAPMALAQGNLLTFNIPAENTAQALNDFAKQANVQILFPYDIAEKYTSLALKGSLTRAAALDELLANTSLEIASQSDTTISLRVKESPGATASEATTEVIVTGSHIRGGNPTSPVHVVTRSDIEESGYSEVGDLVRSLPENFAGGQNPGILGATATIAGNGNVSSGSTVDLHGLGTDATLVLLNGHRLSADSFHQGSDISGIPLDAIQRIEIVPDGASALYGSDAVAGVANFILRKNYSGSEVTGTIGATAEGGGAERRVSALSGTTGENWYILGNLERSTQDDITAGQRRFTAGAPSDETLVPSMDRTSLFVSAGWSPTQRLSLSMDALVSDRSADQIFQSSPASTVYTDATATPAYTVSVTADVTLFSDWKLHVTDVDAGSRNSDHSASMYGDSLVLYRNYTRYAEATADGTLFHLGSGDVKAAFGLGQRTEGYINDYSGASDYFSVSRAIDYAFAETSIPFVEPSLSRTGLHELELDLSGRTEHYSEFGTASMPRVGLRYVPFNDFTLRGSWGKSFKAPSFTQLYSPLILYYFPANWLGGGNGTALETYGGNPNLKPERSTAWTFGGEYATTHFHHLKLGLTYFNVDYRDRVIQPIDNLAVALSDPEYAPFVESNPSGGELSSLIASAANFYNFAGTTYSPSAVAALIQERYENASAQTVHGVDLSYRQSFTLPVGTLSTFANSTWLTLDEQTLSTLPVQTLSGTIFYAPKFKARGGLSWSRGPITANALVNYISSEIDNGVTPGAEVASWTTVDASIAYAFAKGAGALSGVRISLAASNLFDRNPPYAANPNDFVGLNYDSTNASIVGRFVSLNVTKAW